MDLTSTSQPESAESYGFGFAEVAYVLRSTSTAQARKSAAVLRLTDELDSDQLCVAGASSLLARGFASAQGEDIELEGPAMVLAYALAQATRWTEISLMTGDSIDTVVHVESDKVKVLLQPRTLSTWFVFAQDPTLDGAAAEMDIIEEHVRQTKTGTAYVLSRTLDSEDHLMIRPDSQAWAIGQAKDPAADVVERTGLSSEDVLASLSGLRAALVS
ncbi:hypothetical protein SAMN04489740_3689 [Arthrobacter alpinus]|uniref:Uncharacterized protein n=1 Tax=Arthrobacter alpinus TaxID=656366 RepID=A0A1H5NIP0_9MICC|nr:hypothetical protein [Arthrobacter alpinus]SEF00697.1 hypothetical protein SAMN04489740_3689 [Arthrobacter alpinus]